MRAIKKTVYLIGLPGSGKSTVGALLAQRFAVPFTDLDDVIVAHEGKQISEIFEQEGEAYFRKVEATCLRSLTEAAKVRVVAAGGGTPCFFDNMSAMNGAGTTCYLKTSWHTLASRVALEENVRPLFKGLSKENVESQLEDKFSWRLPFYEKSQLVVAADNRTCQEIVSQISDLLLKHEADSK